jgi:hypothetical protein
MIKVRDDLSDDARTEEYRKLVMKWHREVTDKFTVDEKMLSVSKPCVNLMRVITK